MRNYYFLIVLPFFFGGCVALRSGEGLSENEISINYSAPLAGSLRYGITNNIETRIAATGVLPSADVYFHTNSTLESFNYGVTLGIIPQKGEKPFFYGGATISKRINEYVSPYVTYTNIRTFESHWISTSYVPFIQAQVEEVKYVHFFSIGTEWRFLLSRENTTNFFIVPEVTIVFPPIGGEMISTPVIGTINFGFSFNPFAVFK